MIIIFSKRKSKYESEIVEILTKYGFSHYCDNNIIIGENNLTSISIYKPTKLNLINAIAIFTEKTPRFCSQKFPIGVIGISEENNKSALSCFKNSGNAVITCGINSKNTVTISSITNNNVLVTLQRTIIDTNGNQLEPMEFKIINTKNYSPYSVMAATIALIINGITPLEF